MLTSSRLHLCTHLQKGGRQSAPGAGLVPAFDIGELDVGVMGEEDDDDTSSDDMGSDGSDMDDE
jgi:hypothetical protein